MEYIVIQKSLLKWLRDNKRNLTRRKYRAWYNVWNTEIMLQQIQLNKVKTTN